jgi:hypothetical protein
MPLPERIRVKLSSEVAEAISLTPVVVQELPLREFLEHMLAVSGKDEPRIRETLLRGTMVSGATRFRWVGWEADMSELRPLLAQFPDPDPARPFESARCTRVILRGGRVTIDIARETAQRKGMFARRTFWDGLMEVVAGGSASYAGYSYRDRADRYLRQLLPDETRRICQAADRSKFTTLRNQVRTTSFNHAELFAGR